VQRWYAGSPDMGHAIGATSLPPDYPPDEPNYEEAVPQ